MAPSSDKGIFSTVYVKDIEERYDIKESTRMSNLVKYVMRNIGTAHPQGNHQTI